MPASSPPRETWRTALVARIRDEALPPEKFSHQARLYALSRELSASLDQPVDDDVLFAAAWSHDLGVFLGHRPEDPAQLREWNSTAYTVQHAPALLESCGFPAARIAAVVECIRTHEAHARPETAEGTILRDADLLEQIGAVAVMRTTAKIAQDTRFITFADAVASLEQALRQVPDSLRLPSSQALAAPRVAALRAFLNALQAEAQGFLA